MQTGVPVRMGVLKIKFCTHYSLPNLIILELPREKLHDSDKILNNGQP